MSVLGVLARTWRMHQITFEDLLRVNVFVVVVVQQIAPKCGCSGLVLLSLLLTIASQMQMRLTNKQASTSKGQEVKHLS